MSWSGPSRCSTASTWAGRAVKSLAGILAGNLARGQTNTLKMLWKFNSVYDPAAADRRPRSAGPYELTPPPEAVRRDRSQVDLHPSPSRQALEVLDPATEHFVNQTRLKSEPLT